MIRIEAFNPRYTDGVVAVILPIQQTEFAIPITLQAQPDLLNIQSFYQHGNGNFWIALDDERVVGTVALLDIGHRQVALRKMFVAEAYRGAHFSIAKRLLETTIEWCAARRIGEIYLGTTAKFLAAHRFYEKNGFQEITVDRLPSDFPIMKVDTKFYCRRLGNCAEGE